MNQMEEQKKTIAITGASGLLGRYLCDHFYTRGWRVHALVRNTANYPFTLEGIKIFKCTLPDNIDAESIRNVDVLVHCAYMTRFTNLEEAKRVNEDGSERLYDLARKTGVGKFVFVSSRAARSQAESYYAQSKYRIETMLDQSKDLIVRPGLILAKDGGLFYRIVNQVRRLPVVPVFGGGGQRLHTIHIDDLCKIFEWALENEMSGVITVAEPEGITMRDLLSSVLNELEHNKLIVSVPGRPVIWLLQFLEALKLKLPVSSENLRGLLNREDMGAACSESVKQSGISIRQSRESIKDLISQLQ